jgi:hypothetical protein
LILFPFSATCVHMLIPMLSSFILLTGGSTQFSGVLKRKRRFIRDEHGVLVDEVAIRQCKREA